LASWKITSRVQRRAYASKDERGADGHVGAEERLVRAAAAGVADHDDPDGLARQRDALAVLAGQGVVDQHVQRLVGRDPRQRQPEQHPSDRVQRPDRPGEEPVEDRDVPAPERPGGERHRRDGAPGLVRVVPAGVHRVQS
jgi:hypothetical protein